MKKQILLSAFILFLFIPALVFASESEKNTQNEYKIYYVDTQELKIGDDSYKSEQNTANQILQGLIDTYNTGHREGTLRYLPNDIMIETWSLQDNTLTLNLSEQYHELDIAQDVLARAAFVKTFTQFPEVLFVVCTVEEEEITDAGGNPVGRMGADTFVEMNSSDREAYRYDTFLLYFTDKDGEKLIPERRRVFYRRSIPKARVALEQLANGPMEKGNYPTIPSGVALQSVMIADGVCYVDFDDVFVTEPIEGVSPETAVYSVAHTLIANTDAEEAEIMIDGDSDARFGEIELYRFFGWNEEKCPKEE